VSAEITNRTLSLTRRRGLFNLGKEVVSQEVYRIYRMTEASATRSCTYELWVDRGTHRPFRLRTTFRGEMPCRHNPMMTLPQVEFDDFNRVETIRVPDEAENSSKTGARQEPGEQLGGPVIPLVGDLPPVYVPQSMLD
jgi:negative regulator of sigma E activity